MITELFTQVLNLVHLTSSSRLLEQYFLLRITEPHATVNNSIAAIVVTHLYLAPTCFSFLGDAQFLLQAQCFSSFFLFSLKSLLL